MIIGPGSRDITTKGHSYPEVTLYVSFPYPR